MKQLKWITVLFAVLALVLGGAALAETSGTDSNITWELTGDGTLLISGNGPMEDYSFSHVDEQYRTTAPWGCEFTSVVIEAGVTGIDRNAFYGCESLTTVTLHYPRALRTSATAPSGCAKAFRVLPFPPV